MLDALSERNIDVKATLSEELQMSDKAGGNGREEFLRENERKWSPNIMRTGWTAIPTVLLEKQHPLSLTPINVNIL